MRRVRTLLMLGVMLGGLPVAGCDALFTGERVARIPLAAAGDGFAPLTVALEPAMNPVALNLQAEYAASATEAGRWNTYRATLTRAGAPVASGEFRINNTSDALSPNAQVVSRTMLVVDIDSPGDYELRIEAVGPAAVTIARAHLELRRNIRRGSERR